MVLSTQVKDPVTDRLIEKAFSAAALSITPLNVTDILASTGTSLAPFSGETEGIVNDAGGGAVVGVWAGIGVGVGDVVDVRVGVAEGVGSGVEADVGAGVGLGVCFTAT
ncbi:MAG: hypothetical protein PHV74_15840, partial [Dehalococcoidia bacterium]|nr:hypothetical protein [Dehalococcoidia bacterium]